MHKRWAVAAGSVLAALLVVGSAGIAFADLVIPVPAPVGQATAAAANVVGVLGVGVTGSAASPTGAAATGNALTVGGKTIVGTTQVGPGSSATKAYDSGTTPLGRLQVLPAQASVTQSPTSRQANSSAALLRGTLLNPSVGSADVLQSQTSATHTGMTSTGSASSDAAVLNLGGANGMTLKVLHSESSSAGKGVTYLLSYNNTPLISVDELGAHLCALALPSILSVSCLSVTGGVGGVASQVLGLQLGGPNGLVTHAIAAAGSGGVGSLAPASSTGPGEAVNVLPSQVSRGNGGQGLARTGVAIGFALSLAVALIALGAVVVAIRRNVLSPGAHAI